MVLGTLFSAITCSEDSVPPPFVTVTYPQFPLTKDVNTFSPKDENIDNDDSDSQTENKAVCSPSTPSKFPARQRNPVTPPSHAISHHGPGEPNATLRFSAPSPEVFKGFRHDLPQTPPTPSIQPLSSRPQRSIRIPDFAQLIYKLKLNTDKMLDDPPVYMKRIILLVEIKPKVDVPQRWGFLKIFRQTEQQARYAFASYPAVDTLGVIVALGDFWTYREYERENMRTSPSRSEREDSTFTLSSPAVDTSRAAIYKPLDKFFGAKGYARLQEVESDNALKAIRERIKHLCTRLW